MQPINSFLPIADKTATTLILGSMPGNASLTANQYYAHPRNAFWPIMGNIYHFDASIPYDKRVQALRKAKVAVWDVLQQCIRAGSLDSAIQNGSRIVNDFASFFRQHPHIQLLAFNGGEAETSFKKHVLPDLILPDVHLVKLPSTSPAYTLSFEKKLLAWRNFLNV